MAVNEVPDPKGRDRKPLGVYVIVVLVCGFDGQNGVVAVVWLHGVFSVLVVVSGPDGPLGGLKGCLGVVGEDKCECLFSGPPLEPDFWLTGASPDIGTLTKGEHPVNRRRYVILGFHRKRGSMRLR